MSQNSTPVCPTGCTGPLPSAYFSYCDPELGFGEISLIFFAAQDAECFTDETSSTEWLARLSNTSADPDAIRFFHVSADKPAAEREEIQISLGRKIKTPGTFTINLDVEDVSDLNYEFMRTSQCNQVFRMWYVAGDYLFGGPCGELVNLNLDYVIERGTKSLQKIMGAATWEASFAPERCDNPLVGMIFSDEPAVV